jgi:hypothetical protein
MSFGWWETPVFAVFGWAFVALPKWDEQHKCK